MGMATEHRGIGFVSFEATAAEVVYRYEIGDDEKGFVTNVFNQRGTVGVAEADGGEDFVIPSRFGVMARDSIYEAFCNLAEMCGHHRQFEGYCRAAIGDEQLDQIREHFRLEG
jgi:hypothetical protein